MRCRVLLLSLCSGCASAPEVTYDGLWPEFVAAPVPGEAESARFKPRVPDAETRGRIEHVTGLYVNGDDRYPEERDQLVASDPLAAYWFARTLAAFALVALQASNPSPSALRAESWRDGLMVREPAWERPMRELAGIGAPAAPFVVLELLCSDRSNARVLGQEVLSRMGPEILPAWQRVFDVDDERIRRRGVEIIADWREQTDASREVLVSQSGDQDFGVRAHAYRGLARCGEQFVPQLVEALGSEDPFVRRAVAANVGAFRDRAVAEALVEYLAYCRETGDTDGTRVAVEGLRQISGLSGGRSLDDWRVWLASYSGGP